jgi:hypothetical protein
MAVRKRSQEGQPQECWWRTLASDLQVGSEANVSYRQTSLIPRFADLNSRVGLRERGDELGRSPRLEVGEDPKGLHSINDQL